MRRPSSRRSQVGRPGLDQKSHSPANQAKASLRARSRAGLACQRKASRDIRRMGIRRGKSWQGRFRMAERAETVGTSVNPVPLLPPRPMPPRPADLLPPRNGAPISPGTEEAAGSGPLRTEARHLLVGRGVSLSGEITTCERLTVEGNVEANLHECRDIDIAESGLFKGNATIDNAEIRGRFEGELTVRKRLLIRASGHVAGKIAYAEIEIEHGGNISGQIALYTGEEAIAEQRRLRRAASGD